MLSQLPFHGTAQMTPGFIPRPAISHVIFDFDGTLSWLRHGWPEIMCELFRAHFPVRAGETAAAVHDLLLGEILALNGRPTIFQMIRFCEMVGERGGPALDAETLRAEYQRRLDEAIEQRSRLIRRGAASADDFVVHGARALLEEMQRRRLTLIILSSTIEQRVKAEAQLLHLTSFFGRHIYGGGAEARQFSKKAVISRLLREENIRGENILSFGDGPVEIENTKEAGGAAIAVASDENQNGSGIMDPWKRRQLLAAGADAVIADYREGVALLDYLLAT